MSPYASHPDVPVWLTALNGQLLTRTELDILNFIFYCHKHGCRTSNDRIGIITHHSHATVQRAVMNLYQMDLIAIDNFGKRTRTLKPVRWPDQSSWIKYKKSQGIVKPDPAHRAPHIPPKDKTHPTGVSLGGLSESPIRLGDLLTSEPAVPNLPFGSVGDRVKDYQTNADIHRDKMVRAGWTRAQAERLARHKYPLAKFNED